MHYSVLIVDDEAELSEYTARYFNMSGVSAQYVLDQASALKFFEENTCSLVLLDINLGGDSGFELCQIIRRTRDIPIFFISARSSEDDMLLALTIGGDDYICKPYSLSVLLAKVKAALKRYEAAAEAAQGGNVSAGGAAGGSGSASGLSGDVAAGTSSSAGGSDTGVVPLGNVKIDLRRAVVIRDGKETPLKAMEFRLLVFMLNNRNRIIKKDEFFEKVWETEYVGDVTLNVHIRHLREKIEEDPGNPVFIKTVWGTGFILEDKA
ncbi:MAG: response regulator transcription factor [Eubacterium sp.]|nr:response regulator transcription factor [Eubacterium sp.]